MRERYAWMVENMGKWPSGHGQLTKIRLPDGCGREPFQRRCNLGMIVMDLKAIWEMSAYVRFGSKGDIRLTTLRPSSRRYGCVCF